MKLILVTLLLVTPNGTKNINIAKQTPISNRVRFSLRGKKIILNNQTLFSKFWSVGQTFIKAKIYKKGYWKKNMQFPLEQEKTQTPRHLIKLSIWRGGLGIFDIETQLNYIIKIKCIQRLLNLTNALWKDIMLYRS